MNKNVLKLSAFALLLIIAVSISMVVVFASNGIKISSNMTVGFTGSKNAVVELKAKSFVASNNEEQESHTYNFDGSKYNANLVFNDNLETDLENDSVYYIFELTNKNVDEHNNNLVIKPFLNIIDNRITSELVFSTDGINYAPFVKEYLLLQSNETVYLRLNLRLVGTEDAVVNAKLNFQFLNEADANLKIKETSIVINGEQFSGLTSSLTEINALTTIQTKYNSNNVENWYYDAEFTKLVLKTDVLDLNKPIYAKIK